MAFRGAAALCCVVLAACGARGPEPAPLLAIENGRYQSTVAGTCLTLEFGPRDRQTFRLDADCDGTPESQSAFVMDADEIVTDAGVLTVTAVGTTSFSGLWSQSQDAGDGAVEVQFQQVARTSGLDICPRILRRC